VTFADNARRESASTTLRAMTELSKADLGELVKEAIVDAYGENERLTGFYTMIEENLVLPFTTMVLGVEVTVEGIDLTDSGIVAICGCGRHRQPVAILDLPLPAPSPPGSEWITAYGHWAAGR
jgi:Calcium binding